MRSSPIPFAMLGLGIIIGAGLMMAAMPVPMKDIKCQTYGVSHKVATSYVLKPPPSPVVYKACPQVTQKCDQFAESMIEKPMAEEKHRPRRHHRVRRYWR